ncbi:MAG: DUF5659 domain-containing protein [Parcubacteria group bacterium]
MIHNQKSKRAEKCGRISPADSKGFYCTYDLGCASALVSSGFEIASLIKTNPKKIQFVFCHKVGMQKIIDSYWSDKLTIRARSFFDNTKMLKCRIYSEQTYSNNDKS